jgi:hypothetical protein
MKKLALLLAVVITAATGWTQTPAKPSAGTPLHTSAARITPAAADSNAALRNGEAVTLPVGTPIYMTVDTALTTGRSLAGDHFVAHISRPVVRDGRTIIPQGAAVEGIVTNVSEPRRIQGKPSIMVRPETVMLPGGERWPLHAVVVDTSLYPALDVSDEGAIQGKGHDSDDWKNTGIGAGGGAVIGALAGGGVGALAGAAIGTTAGTVHWLAKRRSAEVPAGTELILELSRPLEPASVMAAE